MRIFNTISGKKEEFVPLVPGKVSMYSCGPTVYNYFHIGNARPFIIFDTLRRYFEYLGYEVNFVQNFTDIDDKMINRANDEGITVKELAERFIGEYFKDAEGLGIKKATVHPRATENIDEIIKLVKTLEDKGFAYNVDGDVYFSTKKFKEYGKLSKQPLDDLEAGARINVNEQKRDPMDFAVWKKQKPGEPAWESPWGMGRPGWHIECSAMACRYLGETIDIHSGGKDLIFPHHENEIAQSECAHDKTFARYWMHNGYININNQKMSKSLNNFFTVREIAQEFDYEVIRFFMLSAHYRNPINFSKDLMEQAKASLDRIKNCLSNLEFISRKAETVNMNESEKAYVEGELESFRNQFKEAMDDDLNTADAVAAIFDLVRSVNSFAKGGISKEASEKCIAMIKELCGVLGFLAEDKEDDIDDEIKELIELRQQARKDKNWAEADRIRDELKAKGIVLKDTPQGIKVERV